MLPYDTIRYLLVLALGVLFPDDVHDPARRHKAEGHDREDDDEERHYEVHFFLHLGRLCWGRSTGFVSVRSYNPRRVEDVGCVQGRTVDEKHTRQESEPHNRSCTALYSLALVFSTAPSAYWATCRRVKANSIVSATALYHGCPRLYSKHSPPTCHLKISLTERTPTTSKHHNLAH